jgi:hypothetical protein
MAGGAWFAVEGFMSERNEQDAHVEPESRGDERDWKVAHEQLLRLARRRAGLDLEEGRWLLVAFRTGAHVRLGHGSFAEYVERVLGYAPRMTHEKLRVAEALETLRAVPQALREGKLSWSAVRELTRVATAHTEGEWLAAAQGRTVRDVERLVSGHGFGSRPQDPVDPQLRRHVVRFEVGGETLAALRDALARIRRDAGGPLDDDATLLLMARQVLGGPKDEGRASYQLAMTVCEDCGRARQHAHGELIDVVPEVVEMARCDAQHLAGATTHVGREDGDATTHVGREEVPRRRARRRAKQDVPPAVRRFVLRRDEGRCVFPGCRHATFLDIHHIEHKALGGDHHPDNLVTVCGAHHRAIHRGDVILEGSVSSGLRFRHADGSEYGIGVGFATATDFAKATDAEVPARAEPEGGYELGPGLEPESGSDPSPTKLRASCYRALRQMGFAEQEARSALEYALTHMGPKPKLEQLVRQALRALTGDLAHAS